jgi:hypothetical protein
VLKSSARSDFAVRALKIEDHQKPSEADVLAGGHADFDNFGVAERRAQAAEEIVIDRLVIDGEFLGEFDRGALALVEGRVGPEIFEALNLVLAESAFRRRRKPRIPSREAAVQGGYAQPHELFQRGRNDAAVVHRVVPLEVAVKEVRAMSQYARDGRVRAGTLGGLGLLAETLGQFLVGQNLESRHGVLDTQRV